MKLGFGLYRQSLTQDNFRFAKQTGATHVVVHLVDYFKGSSPSLSRGDDRLGWGVTRNQGKLWELEELLAIKKEIQSHGLVWEAIENFDPSHWYDVLLDGPRKKEQLEDLKVMIRNIGKAGIPIMGYNFSIAGVWGWTKQAVGRGSANSLVFDAEAVDVSLPIPNGMVWNMVYDPDVHSGNLPTISCQEIWERLEYFLKILVPVAEENGVRLAAHPDDPPVDSLRGAARLVNEPDKYERLLNLVPSSSNALEYCLGSVQEMREGDLYGNLDKFSKSGDVAYVHARNVKGKVPHYQEVFIDEGDIDMKQALNILYRNGYDGIIIPDHTPEMSCGAPWHAGMAFAMGYLRATLESVTGSRF
ncbi:mannonate dehydratase [Puniceicoccaceae bacterium K14]|nr:mannonate dehydratase [Puniceicoccaceae bacterium K14]